MVQAQLTQIIKEYSARSFYGFVKTFWSTVEPNEYVDNWHIRKVCDILQKRFEVFVSPTSAELEDLLFNLPPGSTKSMLISVFFPA